VLSHEQVRKAVARLDNGELDLWTETPDAYFADSVVVPGMQHHVLYRVTPARTSRPMSFFLAVESATGQALVTTENAAEVAQLIRTEPGLCRAETFPEQVFELLRPQGAPLRLIHTAAELPPPLSHRAGSVEPPRVTQLPDGWDINFFVADGSHRLVRWTIRFPQHGPGVLREEVLEAPAEEAEHVGF